MAIKAGDLIHVGNQIVVDRLQTAGPGTLNVRQERIYELGNYQTVGIVRDIPDLSFSMESLDASCELESLLLNTDFTTDAAQTAYDISAAKPLDVVSEFKLGRNATSKYDVGMSAVIPYLCLESLSYRFGLRDNAGVTATLSGDSLYYAAGSGYVYEVAGSNTANQAIALPNPVLIYTDPNTGTARRALGVSLANSGKRLFLGTDYTEATVSTTTTVTILAAVAVSEKIRISYQSATVANYPQASHAAASATRPAALKGRNIDVRVSPTGTSGSAAAANRWTSVQSATAEYRVTLDRDEEFGNAYAVNQDYDVPAVSGTIEVKPRDLAEFMSRLRTAANVSVTTEVVGAQTFAPLALDYVLKSPTDGSVLKTIYCADAVLSLPGYSQRTESKATISFPWESQGGQLVVYKGTRP